MHNVHMNYLCTITEPIEGNSGTWCPACQRILPDALFKRRLTPAQARARGYTMPGDVVYATWTECRECSPPPRRATLRTMTSRQIHNAMMDGDVRASVAQHYFEHAKQRENIGRLMGVKRRWDNEWAERWHYARAQLRAELRSTTDRLQYAHKNPPREGYESFVAFLKKYRSVLRRVISWMTDQAKNPAGREHLRQMRQAQQRHADPWAPQRRGRPPRKLLSGRLDLVMSEQSEWRHYLQQDEERELLALWRVLSPEVLRSRLPIVLLLATDETRWCLRGFTPSSAPDADAQARLALLDGVEPEPADEQIPRVKPNVQPDCIDHGMTGFGPGYAHIRINGKLFLRHRVAYAKHHGLGPDELPPVVRHTCDNPRCVNPEHLIGGTHADNMADRKERGRTNRGVMLALTPGQVKEVQRLRAEGHTKKELADAFAVSLITVDRALKR